jgi:uncharacterized protein
MKPGDLIDDLLTSLDGDEPVRSILVGAHWTVVCSRRCGMASTSLGNQPHAEDKVRDAGQLHLKTARALAELAHSDNPLEATIGIAAMNSLIEVDEKNFVDLNAAEVLAENGKGKQVALVGHFPFIPKLRQAAGKLWVIEKNPAEGEYPAEAAADLIPQADVVALTGSAIITHTLGQLLSLCRPGALVVVIGPTTPLSPVMFAHGAAILSGSLVIDEAAVMRAAGQGAHFQQITGVRKVTMRKPG